MQIVAGVLVLAVLYRLTSWLVSYGFSGVIRRTLVAGGNHTGWNR